MEQKISNTNIKVAVRTRPLIPCEKDKKMRIQWATQQNIIYQIDDRGQKFGEAYSFDHIFGPEKTNLDIYNEVVEDFVVSSLGGLNSTIFAYGQTSSGKTYTMSGDKKDIGIMSLAIENIFNIIEQNINRKYLIRVSYIEIYNEKINDLLDPQNKDIKIRELYPTAIVMQNVKEEIVSSGQEMYEYLRRGNINRHIGSTKANDKSSRSHTIFKIMIESTYADDTDNAAVQVSNLNLVDLAGSERVAQTKATGMRLKEGGHINKSLSALGLVIKQLSESQDFVNFRDSKLTRLLQDSLGGNSKTLIIATITLVSVEDTASTLAFAQRAKTVKNKPQVNEILSDTDVSKRYAALNAHLQKKLDEQVLINQRLRRVQEENSKEMLRLQQQKEQLEDFQNRKRTPKCRNLPKRRHTIGFSARKPLFRLPREDSEEGNENSFDLTSFEDFPDNELSWSLSNLNKVEGLEPILEEDDIFASTSFSEKLQDTPTRSTPEKFLRMRLSCLEHDYNELVTFTRDEENILNETSKMVEQLQENLHIAHLKIKRFEDMEDLEEKFRIREQELAEIMKQLVRLRDILSSPELIDDLEDTKEKEDSVLHIMETFNWKVKISKEMVENEIIKQINNFNQTNHDRTSLRNESNSFNHLLNELSLFESDTPVELLNNMKKDGIEDLKLLIKIYESLLEKNEFLGRCFERIKLLEENKESSETESHCADSKRSLENSEEFFKSESEKQSPAEESKTFKVQPDTSQSEELTKLRKDNEDTLLNECEKDNLHQQYLNICCELEQLKKDNELMKVNKDSFQEREYKLEQEFKTHLMNKDKLIEEKEKCLLILNNEKEELSYENGVLKNEINVLKKRILTCDELSKLKCECEKLELQSKAAEFDHLEEKSIDKDNALEEKENIIRILENEKEKLFNENEVLKNEQETLEQKYRTFTEAKNVESNDLKKQLIDKDKIVEEKEKNLKILEMERDNFANKNDELCDRLSDNNENISALNEEVKTLKSAIADKETIIVEMQQTRADLLKELENLTVQNTDLQSEIDRLKDAVMTNRQSTNSFEQKIQSNELIIQRQEQLLDDVQTQVSDLKAALSEKEKVVSSCTEHRAYNEQLQEQIKNLQEEIANLKDNSKCLELETRIRTLNDIREQTNVALRKIVDYFINEHKALLLVRHCQDERYRFRSVVGDLKTNNTVLKNLVNLLLTENSDLAIFSDIVIKCDSTFKKYSNVEKNILNEQIKQLEATNKAYLEEIKALNDSKENINTAGCPHCDNMKSQLANLRKENTERMKQIVALQRKLYEDQDKKADIQYSEWLKFCRETDKMQQQQIRKLQQQIERYKHSAEADKNSAEVQCELLYEDPARQEKYNLMKSLCLKKKEEITNLKCELSKLQKTTECLTDLKENIQDTRTVSSITVQCDILNFDKYSLMKKVCINRKEEVAALKRQLSSLRGAQ